MADTVTLTIDGKQVTVPAGTLVIDAARAAGIEIPVFCSHPRLEPVGVCRMCMVEYVTPRGNRVDISCTIPVTEGMEVRTDTPGVVAAREAVLGFLLINHPLDCPICDKGGECPLQDQTLQYGPGASKFVEVKTHKAKHYPVSDLIMLDQERCVLCWRCTRYLQEWEGKPQLGLFQRGDRTVIDIFPGQPVDVKTSGSIIDLCPVGALTDRTARFHYRPWELKKTPSVCNHCAVGCNLRLDERAHTLRRIVARENPAVNDMWICDKGRFVHDHVDHAERLKTPLVRENGSLRPATWDEAINRVIERLATVEDAHGANAVGGVASGRVSNEAAYLFQKFFRVMIGTNNVDFPTGAAVHALPTGLSAIADVAKSDLIVMVGLDTNESAPVLDMFIKRAARSKKSRLLVIHPRCTELARYASAHLPARPGSETAVLNGLVASLLGRRAGENGKRRASAGAAQPASADEWGWARASTPERVAAASGVQAASLDSAAELLAGAQHPLFLYGPEVATGERGKATLAALLNLANLLGHGDQVAYIPGETNSQGLRDAGLLPGLLPGQQPVADAAARERLGRLWGTPPPAEPGLPYAQMVSGGVRALFVMGANPAADPKLASALRGLDFLVVQDLFLSETAQLADVVLPAVSFAEADGTYTNMERRVQRAPKAVQNVGDSLPDWAILAVLGQRWLAAQETPAAAETAAEVPEWKRKRRRARAAAGSKAAPKPWNYSSAAAVLEEITKAVPFYAGFHWDALGLSGMQWPVSALARPARRIQPVEVPAVGGAAPGSFWLVSGPLLWDHGLVMQYAHTQVQKRIPEPFVALNPADFAAIGLPEGSRVTVAAAQDRASLVLCADDSVQPGMAWIPAGLAGAPAESLGAGRGEPVTITIIRE